MSKKVFEFLLLFTVQIVNYGLICVNMRAVTQAQYPTVVITDFLIASLNFFVIKKISKGEDNLHQWLGYALGGSLGSVFGIALSKLVLGQ